MQEEKRPLRSASLNRYHALGQVNRFCFGTLDGGIRGLCLWEIPTQILLDQGTLGL
jgi:hypothetical protein